ncbi:MAG: hypothetical protein ACOYN0_15695 [Phycisphaerales bacterium]
MKKRHLSFVVAATALLATGAVALATHPASQAATAPAATDETPVKPLPLAPVLMAGLGCYLIISGRKP